MQTRTRELHLLKQVCSDRGANSKELAGLSDRTLVSGLSCAFRFLDNGSFERGKI